jgi:hypothetical protein
MTLTMVIRSEMQMDPERATLMGQLLVIRSEMQMDPERATLMGQLLVIRSGMQMDPERATLMGQLLVIRSGMQMDPERATLMGQLLVIRSGMQMVPERATLMEQLWEDSLAVLLLATLSDLRLVSSTACLRESYLVPQMENLLENHLARQLWEELAVHSEPYSAALDRSMFL